MWRLWGWLRDSGRFVVSSPAVAITVLGAGCIGAAVGVAPGAKLYDYMWRDPVFCGDCHVHDYVNEAWEASVHSELTTCHDCHRVPIRHYPRNLFKAVFVRPATAEDVPNAHVGAVLCEQCHAEDGGHEPLTGPMPDALRASVAKIDRSPLHRVHLDAKQRTPASYQGGHASKDGAPSEGHPAPHEPAAAGGHGGEPTGAIECLDCHGGSDLEVHTFAAEPADCVTCHEGITPLDEQGADLSCLDCHGPGFVGASVAPPTP